MLGTMNAEPARLLTAERNAPEVEAAFEAVPPEMVAEILDGELFTFRRPARPHTRSASRREGVSHVWLLTPLQQTLEVYRLEAGRWVLLDTHEGDARVRVEPFEAMELDLSTIWAR